MMLRSIFLALLLSLALCARAENGVLIENIPANLDKAAALAAARDALQNRDWKVGAQNADSVSATISRNNIEARIRIIANGTRLLYEESARGRPKMDHTGRLVPTATATPERWIEYLRSDVTEGLKTRAAAGPAAPARADSVSAKPQLASDAPTAKRGTAAERMQELKDLLDKSLITADEYGRKREEILKSL